jgi:hypothetical protein
VADPLDTYEQTIQDASREWDIDPTALKGLIKHESGGNPNARGRSGEFGLTQIMPGTAAHLGVTNIRDPVQQIFGGAKYLSEALDHEGGDPYRALAYYNGGPGWRGNPRRDPNYPGYVFGQMKQYAKADAGSMTDASPAPAPADSTPKPEGGTKVAAATLPSDDEFLKELHGSAAKPTAPTDDGKAALPSDAEFLKELHSTAAAPNPRLAATQPQPAPGGPKPGEQIGVYSKAGTYGNDMIPGQRSTAPPAAQPPAPDTGDNTGERGPLGNIVAAGEEAYRNTPALLTPEAQAAAQQSWLGRNVLIPAANFGSTALADLGAVGGAIGQGTYELGKAIGGEQMGRDFYMGGQVAPVMAAGLPGGLLRGQVAKTFGREPPPVRPPEAPLPGVNALSPEAQARIAMRPPGETEPMPAAPPPERPVPGGIPPEQPVQANPQAVGAQWAGGAGPPMTEAQRIASLEKSVTQSAEDRAGTQLKDDTQYVQGIPHRTLAGQDFSDSAHALDEKHRMAANTDFRNKVEAINRERNQGMTDLLAKDAGDANSLEAAHQVRSQVSPDKLGVFEGEAPVDASNLVKMVDDELQGRGGKRDAVRTVLGKVRASLLDADGNPESSPSQLYGARQNITDMLQKAVKGTGDEADAVRAVKQKLTSFLEPIDQKITEGAPQFQNYLRAWHELSKPIDQQEFLQKYTTGTGKLTDQTGYLQPNKVQKMLSDILAGNKASGNNAAKSLTDAQIGNIIAVRNELATQPLQRRLAAVPGSDTFQQINRASKFTGPIGNALRLVGDVGTLGIARKVGGEAIQRYEARRIARQTSARENALLGGIPPQQ